MLVRGRPAEAGEVHPLAGGDHRLGPGGKLPRAHPVEQDGHGQRRHLLVGDDTLDVRVDDPADLRAGQLTPVALGTDDVDGVHGRGHLRFRRSSGPKAAGRSSRSGRAPPEASTRSSGPPCSQSSWRQRPHGISGSPRPSTQLNAISRPPPLAYRAETRPHSAHSPSPYEAFSTLQPATIRPSSTSAAAPTGKDEYGAYARPMISRAASRSASQSISAPVIRPYLVGTGGRRRPACAAVEPPATARAAWSGAGRRT